MGPNEGPRPGGRRRTDGKQPRAAGRDSVLLRAFYFKIYGTFGTLNRPVSQNCSGRTLFEKTTTKGRDPNPDKRLKMR